MRTLHQTLVIGVLLAACSPDTQGDPSPVAPLAVQDPLACTGDAAARGSALRQAIEGAEEGATISLGPCVYFVLDTLRDDLDHRQDTLYNAGIRIEGKKGLTIHGAGQGRTVVRFARPVLLGFEIQSYTTDLTIRDMTIAGSITRPLCEESPDLPTCYGGRTSHRPNTHGIASTARTAGVRAIRLTDLELRDLAVGISVGTWGNQYCDYAGALIERNYVHDMHGTHSGSGYGIHVGCATGIEIRENVIERAGRHSMYIARSPASSPDGTVVVGNTIIDHGHDEAPNERAAAIAVVRSDNVTVVDNTLIRSHAFGISAEFDPSTGLDCTRCVFIANKFLNVTDVEDIWINAQSPVWIWANERGGEGPAVILDETGMARDASGPDRAWAGTQAVEAIYDPEAGEDHLLVMQHDRLHMVRPDYGADFESGWRNLRHSTSEWTGFRAMTSDREWLYVWQDDSLHAVQFEWSNAEWPYTSAAGWPGRGELESRSDGYIYLMREGILHRVDPMSWDSTPWDPRSQEAAGLSIGRESMYLLLGGAVYAAELQEFGAAGALRLID